MKSFTVKQFLPFAAALLLAACTSTDEVDGTGGGGDGVIGFRQPAVSRAAVDDADDVANGGGYQVWASYTPDAGGSATTVFDGTTVYLNTDGKWTYDGEKKYWESGCTYSFCAFYPTEAATYDFNTNRLTATYDVKTQGIGAAAVDLLKASDTRAYDGNNGTVSFNFKHMLSRISVVVKKGADWNELPGNQLAVNNVKMWGFASKGNYAAPYNEEPSVQHWTGSEITTEQNTFFIDSDFPNFVTNGEEQVYEEMFAIPQQVSADMGISLNYTYLDPNSSGETIDKTSTVSLNQFAATEWAAGKSLRYVLTINPNGISFTTMEVPDWTSSFGGSIIVGDDTNQGN